MIINFNYAPQNMHSVFSKEELIVWSELLFAYVRLQFVIRQPHRSTPALASLRWVLLSPRAVSGRFRDMTRPRNPFASPNDLQLHCLTNLTTSFSSRNTCLQIYRSFLTVSFLDIAAWVQQSCTSKYTSLSYSTPHISSFSVPTSP